MQSKVMINKTESGSVTEDDFMVSFEETATIYVLPGREMKERAETIRAGLTSNAWEKRVEHVRLIRGIVKGIEEPDNVMVLLRLIENELRACIVDLRSQIVREACITAAYFSMRLGVRLETAVEPLATALMSLVPNGARVMSTSGKIALKFVYRYTQTKRLLTALCLTLTSSRSTAARQYCCELLCVMCKEWTSRKVEACLTSFCEALKKGICDPDTDSRTSARKAFVYFHNRFTKQAETLLLSLDASKRTQLQKELTVAKAVQLKTTGANTTEKSRDASHASSTSSLVEKRAPPVPTFLQQLLPQLNCRASKERKSAMESIQAFILSSTMSPKDVESLANSFDLCYVENDSDVRASFLLTMLVFVEHCLDDMAPWMKTLLSKLLPLKFSPLWNGCEDKLDAIITHVLQHSPDKFFDHCCDIVVESSVKFNAELNVCLCGLIVRVLDVGVVFDRPTRTLNAFVSVLLAWTGDTRDLQLKKEAHQLLLKLTRIDNARMNALIASLPYPTQMRACTTIAYSNSPSKIPKSARLSVNSNIATNFIMPRPVSVEEELLKKTPIRGILTSHNLNCLLENDNKKCQHIKSEKKQQQPIRDDIKPIQPIINEIPQIQPIKNDIPQIQPIKNDVPQIQPIKNDIPQIQPIINDIPQIQPIKYDIPQIQPISDNLPKTNTTADFTLNLADLICALPTEDDVKSICTLLGQIRSELARSACQTVDDSLRNLCEALARLVSHANSSVRKQSIVTLVAMYSVVGERLWQYMTLDIVQRALFNIYVHKAQP